MAVDAPVPLQPAAPQVTPPARAAIDPTATAKDSGRRPLPRHRSRHDREREAEEASAGPPRGRHIDLWV
ncbi:MAG: hypothetical protein MJE66_21590 [Proteobacteria bacterium]|nr:hypothetical protein [Pseudomonadota bacterium]